MEYVVTRNSTAYTIELVHRNCVIATAILEAVPRSADAWMLGFIEVDEEHRRCGIATELFKRSRALAKQHGKQLILMSDLSDDAFAFFRVADPAGLKAALLRKGAHLYVLREGGDPERFREHVAEISRPLC